MAVDDQFGGFPTGFISVQCTGQLATVMVGGSSGDKDDKV